MANRNILKERTAYYDINIFLKIVICKYINILPWKQGEGKKEYNMRLSEYKIEVED